jgi:hypothetical protein
MNYITIKNHETDGLVAVEMYNTDTDAVGGFTVCAMNLWPWLWRCRPCQVNVNGRVYSLKNPVTQTRPPIPNLYRAWQAGARIDRTAATWELSTPRSR